MASRMCDLVCIAEVSVEESELPLSPLHFTFSIVQFHLVFVVRSSLLSMPKYCSSIPFAEVVFLLQLQCKSTHAYFSTKILLTLHAPTYVAVNYTFFLDIHLYI